MKPCVILAGLLAALVAGTQPAAAQTPALPAMPAWFGGVEVGVQAVENVGALGGVQLGRHLSPRADLFGEAVYLADIASRRRAEAADKVATYLAASQGHPASGSIEVPTWAFSGGIRFFLTGERSLRPYVIGQGGMARATLQPTFELAGADVTATTDQYGVTLGADLTGNSFKPMFGGGFGVLMRHGAWYVDAGVRVINVQLDDQPANSTTLAVGFGRGF